MKQGTLFYLIGPSGAGKDALLAYARDQLAGSSPVLFSHRYITSLCRQLNLTNGSNSVCSP
jgi:ribose 1,5-bisphosphokinase